MSNQQQGAHAVPAHAVPAELQSLTPAGMRRKLHSVIAAYPYLRYRVERISFLPAGADSGTARAIAQGITDGVVAGLATAHDLQVIAQLVCCVLPEIECGAHGAQERQQ